MLVAGGGVIGCEYACMFAALGVQVSLVEGRDRLLGFLDSEISSILALNLESMGVNLQMSDSIVSVEPGATLTVRFQSGKSCEVESILAATGRSGNTRGLGLEQIGIQPDNRGLIKVNERYQTALPHIYAVGDVIGFPALASTSMEQARVAMVHAFDLKYKSGVAALLPYGIYTIPECSMVGETEETAEKKGIPYVIGKAWYHQNARGQIIGEKQGFLKLVFRREDMRLIGVHVIGEQASELVHTGLCAMLMEAGADLFIQTCFNYPTLSEMYKYATYDALGRRAKMAN
jgi:NAD(P) transhydrogenase